MTARHARQPADIEVAAGEAAPAVRCTGAWTVQGLARLERRLAAFPWPAGNELLIDASGMSALDTSGAWLLLRIVRLLERQGRSVRIDGLRPEFGALLHLLTPYAEKSPAPPQRTGLLTRTGRWMVFAAQGLFDMLAFVGESATTLLHSLADPRRVRWRPILHNLQIAGVEALPISGLLSFLMGLVIAYQGAGQLQRFGANIFIADLVGLAMLRELAPLLTAIIVAGRSGSAYAAQIGTMKVNEEIDALRTIGVGTQDLLVLPKMLALIVALPLLTVYCDVTGVLGGMLMARSQLDVGFDAFLNRLVDAISLSSFLTGVAKAPVFAAIIALVGCFQGLQVGGSAESVGTRTTVSVVQAIFLVIVADALFSVVFNWLNL